MGKIPEGSSVVHGSSIAMGTISARTSRELAHGLALLSEQGKAVVANGLVLPRGREEDAVAPRKSAKENIARSRMRSVSSLGRH